MTSTNGLKPVFGTGGWTRGSHDDETLQKIYSRLEKYGVTTLDTARLYGDSESLIGSSKAAERFTIDSKTPGGFTHEAKSGADIEQHVKDTIDRTGAKQLDIYYIHAPDESFPFEEQLKALNNAHQKGYFRRLGLSNFTVDQVQKMYDIATEHGYIRPSVYQGNYNAIARRQETELFPTLRRLGMSFYAYSPIAGGFLTKTAEQIREGGPAAGRFAKGAVGGAIYNGLYNNDSYLKALELWGKAAKAANASQGELAYRWVAFDSPLSKEHGDAIIFGTSKLEQIEETLQWLQKGSIGTEARKLVDEIWETIKDDAPLDNYNSHVKDKGMNIQKLS